MTQTRSPTTATLAENEPVITMERLVDAPREMVFEAFADAEALKQWWGPNGFTITILERDFRPGGVYRFIMHAPNGMNFANRILYREIVSNELIAYTHGADAGDPDAFEVTVTFKAEGGRTRVVIRSVFPSMERRNVVIGFGAVELGKQNWDKLAAWAEARAR